METRLFFSKWGKERKEHRGQVGLGAASGLGEGQPLHLASDAVELPWVRFPHLHSVSSGTGSSGLDYSPLTPRGPGQQRTAAVASAYQGHHISLRSEPKERIFKLLSPTAKEVCHELNLAHSPFHPYDKFG